MRKGHFLFDRSGKTDNHNMATTESEKSKTPPIASSQDEQLQKRDYFKKKRAYEKAQVSKKLSKLEEYLSKDILSKPEKSQMSKWTQEIAQRMKTLEEYQEQVILNGHGDPDRDEESSYLDIIESAVDDITLRTQVRLKSTKKSRHSSSSRSSISSISGSEDDDDDDHFSSRFRAGKRRPKEELSQDQKNFYALLSMTYDIETKVPKFDGSDIAKYPSFRQAWETADKNMDRMGKTPAEKLLELKKVLEGKALRYIGNLTDSHDRNYEGALEMLDQYYYDNQVTGKEAIDKMLSLPQAGFDANSMEENLFDLSSIYQVLEGLELSTRDWKTLVFTVLAEKTININGKRSWAKKCEQKEDNRHPLGHSATIKDFFDVLKREIKLTRQTTSPKKKHEKKEEEKKEEKKKEEKKKEERKTLPGSFGAQKSGQENEERRKCLFCTKTGHPVWKCRDFKSKSVPERWTWVKDNKVCRLCFDKHRTEDCKLKKCNIENCGKPHSRLLHSTKRVTSNATTRQSRENTEHTTENPPTTNCSVNSKYSTTHKAILQSCLAWA